MVTGDGRLVDWQVFGLVWLSGDASTSWPLIGHMGQQ
jgi:hypothetical protein